MADKKKKSGTKKSTDTDLQSFAKEFGDQYIDAIDDMYGDGIFDRFLAKIQKAVSNVVLKAALNDPRIKAMSKTDKDSRARLKKFGDYMRKKDPKGWKRADAQLRRKYGID